MDVRLLVIPGCPGAEEASRLLRTALDDVGLTDVAFSVDVIDSEDTAKARAFRGSPAFVFDGTDVFPTTARAGVMACRVYQTADGLRNVPDVQDLRRALEGVLTGRS